MPSKTMSSITEDFCTKRAQAWKKGLDIHSSQRVTFEEFNERLATLGRARSLPREPNFATVQGVVSQLQQVLEGKVQNDEGTSPL